MTRSIEDIRDALDEINADLRRHNAKEPRDTYSLAYENWQQEERWILGDRSELLDELAAAQAELEDEDETAPQLSKYARKVAARAAT